MLVDRSIIFGQKRIRRHQSRLSWALHTILGGGVSEEPIYSVIITWKETIFDTLTKILQKSGLLSYNFHVCSLNLHEAKN